MLTFVFLALRALHVLVAAIWIGSTLFVSKMLTPVVEASGPSGGQVMMRLNRPVTIFMASIAATTVGSGLYLLWHFTGFDPEVMLTHAGLAFCVGGTSGILAGIIGGAVVGRSALQVGTIMNQAVALPDGPSKGALMQQAASLRIRVRRGGNIVLALQTIALVLMALGHYV